MTERQIGRWRVARSIDDRDRGVSSDCTGEAQLIRDGDRLRYEEAVTLVLDGRLIRATRSYLYRATGSTVEATFADGSPFFSTSVGPDGVAFALHRCGDDWYTGTIALRENGWQTNWDITGTKRLRIATYYTR